MSRRKAPKSVVKRLPVYLRILDNLIRRDIEVVSSRVSAMKQVLLQSKLEKIWPTLAPLVPGVQATIPIISGINYSALLAYIVSPKLLLLAMVI